MISSIDLLTCLPRASAGWRAVRAEPVAAFADLEVGEVPRRDAEAGGVFECPHRRRREEIEVFPDPRGLRPFSAVHRFGDLLAAENAEDAVDAGHLFEQGFAWLRSARQPATTTEPILPCDFNSSISRMTASDSRRSWLDEAAGVDDHHVGPAGVGLEGVAVLAELAEHPFGIDGVLRAAERDEREGACRGRQSVGGKQLKSSRPCHFDLTTGNSTFVLGIECNYEPK